MGHPKIKMKHKTIDKDMGEKAILEIVKEMGKAPEGSAYVKVGFLGNEGDKDERKAKEGESNAPSNLQVAVWNEFGTPNAKHPIPERAFMRTTADNITEPMAELSEKLLHKIAFQELLVPQALKIMGLKVQAAIKRTISTWTEPANSDATIASKQKTKGGVVQPLVDTGQMRNALEFEIVYHGGTSVALPESFEDEGGE